MNRLYASPLRVYLLLGGLALLGLYSGFKLPISLFPNTSKPQVDVFIPYGSSTPEEFLNTYGKQLEEQLRKLTTEKVEVETVKATYEPKQARYQVEFRWGNSPTVAEKETAQTVYAFASQLPQESRDQVQVWLNHENSGFFALSYYSETRDLDALYDLLEPILAPRLAKVRDASRPDLWNPSSKEVRVDLNPEAMAAFQLYPKDVEQAVQNFLQSKSGGSLTIGVDPYPIQMPRLIQTVEDMRNVVVPTPEGGALHLSELAQIYSAVKSNDSMSFKTSGAASLILWATPKPGGNVKKMSEDIIEVVKEVQTLVPPDVKYKVLVDPSEFIRSAVFNVLKEVGVAALLAVCVLFLFIGSVRNVITAAIEIPLSMILAFILMRLFGLNLNLISLGGLALSAGMNVDASVVVMENIFRHFEMHPGPHTPASRLRIVSEAVQEVRFPIIASTISSLVVFLPLTLTSDLSYALLGDLALAVVFSHGFSAIVALILVPTVRLQLMSLEKSHNISHSPIEKALKWIEHFYAASLGAFIRRKNVKWGTYAACFGVLILLAFVVLPRLPREVIGKPDTDWMVLNVDTNGNTLIRQMEIQAEEVEQRLLKKYGSKISYTFNQIIDPNFASIMARLKDKSEMRSVWKQMEAEFTNTPVRRFRVHPFNPSELPIPDPPNLKVSIRGGDTKARAHIAQEIEHLLEAKDAFPRVESNPNSSPTNAIIIRPHAEQWATLAKQNVRLFPSDLADMARIATSGRRIGQLPIRNHLTDIFLHYPYRTVLDDEGIAALPIGVGKKLVPLKALAEVDVEAAPYSVYREEGRDLFVVQGRESEANGNKQGAIAGEKGKALVAKWIEEHPPKDSVTPSPIVVIEDAAKDLNNAIRELSLAVALSIALIFVTLLLQFGTFVEPLLVLVSVPLGFIGVLASLFIFGSSLSLNSILGVILLNGIAVANSIILVDFIKRLVEQGRTPSEAAVEAARKRLRPILITSLTTVLGMLPVALGLGEGGRILQPLGIAVSGGLWISMGLTLFLVPALQVSYLEWKRAPKKVRPFFSSANEEARQTSQLVPNPE